MHDSQNNCRHWFALYVKPRHEKAVAQALRGKGYEELLPLYARYSRSHITHLPLFPGYVFSRFDPIRRLPVLMVPGVFSIVGSCEGPTPVADCEIEALQRVIQSGVSREPWDGIWPGQKVVLTHGPLRGVEGVMLERKSGSRLVITVSLLHRSVAVEIDRAWVGDGRMMGRWLDGQ